MYLLLFPHLIYANSFGCPYVREITLRGQKLRYLSKVPNVLTSRL